MKTTLKSTIKRVAHKANRLYPRFERSIDLSCLLNPSEELMPELIPEPVYVNHTYYYLQ